MVAETLEAMGFTYTGSPPEVLSTGWDKAKVKKRLGSCRVPIPAWKIFTSAHVDGWRKFPAIVKPGPGAFQLRPFKRGGGFVP